MTDTITKLCPKCKKEKHLSEYHSSKNSKSKLKIQPYCKACGAITQRKWIENNPELYKLQKLRQRLRRFNLTVQQFDKLLKDQNGVCAICKTSLNSVSISRLSIDHNHACCKGKQSCGRCIRGLLCNNCNSGLGHFKDNTDLLRSAITYLQLNEAIS